MKAYLIENGFEYKEYPDGWVYEYDSLLEFKQIVSKYK